MLDGSTDIFGGVTGSAASASNPGALVAVGAAFIIGAAMIVLPCGFPSVFAMPSIMSSRKGLHQRAALSLVFVAASAVPLAALGVGLGFGGDAILGLLDSMRAKMTFSVVLYSSLGVLAMAYALSRLGLFHLPNLLSKVSGPSTHPDRITPTGGHWCWEVPWEPAWAWAAQCPPTMPCWAG